MITPEETEAPINTNKTNVNNNQTPETSCSVESTPKSEKQIVEAMLIDIYDFQTLDTDYVNALFETIEMLSGKLSGKLFGSITSEDDAKEKATAAWNEIYPQYEEFLNNATFYEKYDAWLVWGNYPSWTTDSDGNMIPPVPSTVPYIIIRKSDGKVVAAWPS